MNDLINIVKSLEDNGLLKKEVTESAKNKIKKNKKVVFLACY